jgi:Flp pilus assembly protein protease CpaA
LELVLNAIPILLIILFVGMLFDLRNREVPWPLTVFCLIGSGIYGLFQGLWAQVLVIVALTLISDFKSRKKRLVFSGALTILAGVLQTTSFSLSLACLAFWLLWEFGKIGGADCKFLIAVLLVTGTPVVFLPIAVAGGMEGVLAKIIKKREIPFVPAIFCGTLLFYLYTLIPFTA